jgi:FixJ family two-component response regulator
MSRAPGDARSAVFVIDDDASVREALKALFRMVGHAVEAFASVSDFLASKLPEVASCLVLDIRLPGISGLDFQADLAKANIQIPIIFITGHGDIPMTVKAMKAGAVEFLTKPFRDQDMLDAVRTALERDRARRERDQGAAALRAAYETLSEREREVMKHVTAGLMNKQIAAHMGLAEITVKMHRANGIRKMKARTLAELVKMSQSLGITTENS